MSSENTAKKKKNKIQNNKSNPKKILETNVTTMQDKDAVDRLPEWDSELDDENNSMSTSPKKIT